jgi:hypothetical protein
MSFHQKGAIRAYEQSMFVQAKGAAEDADEGLNKTLAYFRQFIPS